MISQEIYLSYTKSGLSAIPCAEKRAQGSWKAFQSAIPSTEQINSFKAPQIALVCGSVSGGLVCLDFDIKNGNKYDDWCILVTDHHPEILSKTVVEKSPSGGYHVIFRTESNIRNLKLAINPSGLCTIETRGEGGYFVCSPSPGYELQYGDITKISKLNSFETDFLISAAISFNEQIKDIPEQRQQSLSSGISPFDDYNLKHDIVGLLISRGWKELFRDGSAVYLQRPGKEGIGVSATWNKIPDRFYCFTTSTQFENQHVYKASAVYAVLNHNGNFNEAAKTLYSAGYGERIKKINTAFEDKPEEKTKLCIINTSSIKSKILDIKLKGYQRGQTTGWKSLDKMFSVAKKQFTVITGVPSAGKSEFMDALAINLMTFNKWKFAVFSPENYPAEMHYHKLIEKICGKELRDTEDADIDCAIKIIDDNFKFIDALEDDITLDTIFSQTKELIKQFKIDALIIDPWNEIELDRPNNISESDFIGKCLRQSRKFARRENIHLFIVAHPTKLQKDKSGKYPIPELWDISGSAHWRNKADNGICVHRDYENNCTNILVQKVKFKYFGRQGECTLYYEESSGRYKEAPIVGANTYYHDF
jgi:hypothetical protein